MVVCRGRVGLTAEIWPVDKASSLQALYWKWREGRGSGLVGWSPSWAGPGRVQVGVRSQTAKRETGGKETEGRMGFRGTAKHSHKATTWNQSLISSSFDSSDIFLVYASTLSPLQDLKATVDAL